MRKACWGLYWQDKDLVYGSFLEQATAEGGWYINGDL